MSKEKDLIEKKLEGEDLEQVSGGVIPRGKDVKKEVHVITGLSGTIVTQGIRHDEAKKILEP